MNSHTILECWSTGSKRSRKDPAVITVKHHNGDFYSFIYELGNSWIAGFREQDAPAELLTPNLPEMLYRYLIRDDLYSTKISIEEDGTILDVSTY